MRLKAIILELLVCAGAVLGPGSSPAAPAIVISEFLAENDGGLHDSDGDSPDWIEIHNVSGSPLNLEGWRLTDSAADLARWTFPATNLAAGGRMVVFASGKDHRAAGAELHTNFQLDNSGEYLALIEPDGTIAHAYDPAFPPQRSNASCGIEQRIALIAPGATVRYQVPGPDSLDGAWTSRTFDDSGWTEAANGVGYDRTHTAANPLTVILAVDFDERGATPATQSGFQSFVINSNVSATAIQTHPTTRAFGSISLTLSNTPPLGYDDRVRTTPVNSGAFTQSRLLRDHILSRELTGTGGLDLSFAGLAPSQDYAVTIWSYDSGSSGKRVSNWYANGSLVRSKYTFDGSVPPARNEDDQFTFGAGSAPDGTLVVSGRRDASSLANSPAVQINAIRLGITGYREQIATDVESVLHGVRSSLCLRMPFTIAHPDSVRSLQLKIRYDDGFVAYVNGQAVASRNAPPLPDPDSSATAAHFGIEPETIPISLTPGLLASGTNILAIHGLNAAAEDDDFLIQAEIEGELGADFPTRYFWPPTPGQANGSGYLGFVADTKFSVNRGFCSAPFHVTVSSATPGASIYWTTNGSPPSPANGFLFTQPVWIDRTLALRAVACAPDRIPTEVETHTYIFLDQVLDQPNSIPGYPTTWQGSYPADYEMDPNIVRHPVYGSTISNDLRSLPSLSIVTSHADLWDTSTGIYRNSTSTGTGWERPASAELILPDGSTAFAINCGLEIHGNASRDNARTPKHSLRLSFKSEYGAAKLRYNWFNGRVDGFDTIVLRGLGFGDAWATRYSDTGLISGTSIMGRRYRPENSTYLKDTWIKQTFREMGHLAPRSDFAHLYLNGLYWGLINPSERNHAPFVASHLGGREMDWDVMAGDEAYASAELRDGSRADWDALIAQVRRGITNEAGYQAILEIVDVVNLIDYMMVHGVAEMEDWPFHNWYAAHRRPASGLPGTQWIFLPWDQEIGMDRFYRRDRIIGWNGSDVANTPGEIYTALRAYPEFRRLYGDRLQKHMFNGGALTPSNAIARFERLGARIFQALAPESARWGDAREFAIGANPGTGQTFTRDEWWVTEMQELYSGYFGGLRELHIGKFREHGLYPWTPAPEFSQFGGDVPAEFALEMAGASTGGAIYYTLDGSDPRVYGTAAIAPSARLYSQPIPIHGPALVSARTLDATGWSAIVQTAFYPPQHIEKLILTEIMYHPLGMGAIDADDLEFIELQNAGAEALNLTGLSFTSGIAFSFTNGTVLAPGEYFVLARNPAAFASRYPGVPVHGQFEGQLADSGESLELSQAGGALVLSVEWADRGPWPVATDGFGFSLVPRDPGLSQAPDRAAAWRSSSRIGGSPGASDGEPEIPRILISEALAHTGPPETDAVELYNPNPTPVAVGGWFLTDAPSIPWKYRIPDPIEIPAFGAIYFTADQFNASPGAPDSFALDSQGDQIYLFSADASGQLTGFSHGFSFGASFQNVSFGRVVNETGEEFFSPQRSPTLGRLNAGPQVGPIVITEVHYHPEDSGFEFIELLNITGSSVPLFDPAHPTNTWSIQGVDYTFPADVTLGPNALLIVANADPIAFRARFEMPSDVAVLGPFGGALQNSGENLQLLAPDHPDGMEAPRVAVEELRYDDRPPWPAGADGGGLSLQRRIPAAFANSPANWRAAAPTPGSLPAEADGDGDGVPDDWETAHQTNPLVPDSDQDPDSDGMTNGQEYAAGTHPQSGQSRLQLEAASDSPSGVMLQFQAAANRTYSVLRQETPAAAVWLKWIDIPAEPADRMVVLTDSAVETWRFYCLQTPALE